VHVIAMAETILGNVNHLSKPANYDYSCKSQAILNLGGL